MIIGSELNWAEILKELDRLDKQTTRKYTDNTQLKHKDFIKLFDEVFHGFNASDHLFTSMIVRYPTERVAVVLASLFSNVAQRDDVLIITDNLTAWAKNIKYILSEDFYEEFNSIEKRIINEYFAREYAILSRLHPKIFKGLELKIVGDLVCLK